MADKTYKSKLHLLATESETYTPSLGHRNESAFAKSLATAETLHAAQILRVHSLLVETR